MLLAIDIGNTNIVIGVFERERLIDYVRVSTNPVLTPDESGFLVSTAIDRMRIKNDNITSAVVCSVVPSLTSTFEKSIEKYFKCQPLVVSHQIKLPITITIDQPEQLGA
ncbi:MAG: type III pantothenate kinase, partial [Candidatus Zixiibacteriota bacterium]